MRVISQNGERVVVSFSVEEWAIAREAVESQRAIDEEEAELAESCTQEWAEQEEQRRAAEEQDGEQDRRLSPEEEKWLRDNVRKA